MAYLFNQVDDANEEKANIFATQPAAGGQPGAPGQQAGGDAVQKTDVGGGGGSAPSGSGQSTLPPKSQAGYNPAAASSAYKSAASSIKMPTAGLERAEENLASSNQALQDKANVYQTKVAETGKGYKLDDATLSGAVQGTDTDFQKTAERLSSKSPGLFESFEGLGSEQPNVENVQDVGSLYREEVGPSYTAGQSRLDAALLRQNPEFLARQQNIMGQAKQLKEADTKAQMDQTKNARDILGTQYDTATADIRTRLGKYGEDVVTTAKGLSAAEEARRAAINPTEIAQAQQQKVKDQVMEALKHADPKSAQYRSLKYLADQYDLGKHVNVDKKTDWREFLKEDQTGIYNRAQGLLGKGEMLQQGKGPGEAQEFLETDAYNSMLAQLREKREAGDVADDERIAAIQAGAEGRISGQQKTLREKYDAMMPEYQKMISGVQFGIPGNVNKENLRALPAYKEVAMDWQSMLTPEEISELHDLQTDSGLDQVTYSNKSDTYGSRNKDIAAQIAAWRLKQPLPSNSEAYKPDPVTGVPVQIAAGRGHNAPPPPPKPREGNRSKNKLNAY